MSKPQENLWKPFVIGGFAGVLATTIIQPLDVLKVRKQISGEGTRVKTSLFTAGRTIYAENGLRGFYAGLGAGYARQIVYGSARLGLFRVFSDAMLNYYKSISSTTSTTTASTSTTITKTTTTLPFYGKAIAGLCAGGLASFIGNPIEIILVRMQADGTLPLASRRGYKNLFDAFYRIVREEGPLTLFRGSSPTILRAMILNMSMLATADEVKERVGPYVGGTTTYTASAISSFAGGVTSAIASLPADLIKTRLQKQVANKDGKFQYTGVLDCAKQIIKNEGFFSLWKGVGVYITRIAPHAVITLSVIDIINKFIKG